MTTRLRRFILQAFDPDHGNPVLEALFVTEHLSELRSLLGIAASDDPGLDGSYDLDAAALAVIKERFDVPFEPNGRDVRLCPWRWLREVPYLIHTGYELALLIEGRKPFARMSEEYPPAQHQNEELFDRYVAKGILHKEIELEPYDRPMRGPDTQLFEGVRTAYYVLEGEEWCIEAWKALRNAARESGWNADHERMEGMLLGYEKWQNDWWMAEYRKRRAGTPG